MNASNKNFDFQGRTRRWNRQIYFCKGSQATEKDYDSSNYKAEG